jgi:uncharacterized protein (DUF169 family)
MRPLQTDMSIYSKFDFENPPVGVKYLFYRPEGIEPLGKSLALCEMLKEAQQRKTPFYFTRENESCFGKTFLGMAGGTSGIADGGELGIKFGIFQEPRDNARLRRLAYSIEPGTINYVAFSPLDKLTFEPDLLLLMANPSQAEILLRAMTYSSGEMYESRSTCIGGCSWLYAYPYLSGKVNYMVTGLSFGMKGRRVFPEGWLLVSIPYQWIPAITRNLKEMEWVLPAYTMNNDDFTEYEHRIIGEIVEKTKNP